MINVTIETADYFKYDTSFCSFLCQPEEKTTSSFHFVLLITDVHNLFLKQLLSLPTCIVFVSQIKNLEIYHTSLLEKGQ